MSRMYWCYAVEYDPRYEEYGIVEAYYEGDELKYTTRQLVTADSVDELRADLRDMLHTTTLPGIPHITVPVEEEEDE